MPTTDRDTQALTYLARRLREDTHGARDWDEPGIYAVIREQLVGKNLAHAVETVLCHATDTEAKTPGSLRRGFLPPKPSERPKDAAHPPRSNEVCRTHPAQRAESCPWCVHGVKAWDELDDSPPAPVTRSGPDAARAALRGAERATTTQGERDA